MKAVETLIEQCAQKLPGKLGVGVRDLQTGEEVFRNGDVQFPSASTFKVPVLAALFQAVKDGRLSLDDKYTLKEEDLSPGSGVLSCLTPGLVMSVRDYATLMMIISDNTAADVVYHLVGKEAIRAMVATLGLTGTTVEMTCRELVLGLFEGVSPDTSMSEYQRNQDTDAYTLSHRLYEDESAPNDLTTPRDMVNFFTLLYREEIVSPEASREMMDIMRCCQTNNRIPRLLPDHGPCKATVIHKTGTLPWVINDCGIVLAGGRAYAIALYYNGFGAADHDRDTSNRSELLLAELSRDIFSVMCPE